MKIMVYPLIGLFLVDLLHLVHQLSHSQLKIVQFVLSNYLLVVNRMFTNLKTQVYSLQKITKCYNDIIILNIHTLIYNVVYHRALYVTRPANIDNVSTNYTKLYFC